MDEHEENFKDIFRYTDVEYTPDGYTDVYRWDDFLVIAGDHVYSAMDTIDSVSPGGEYEGSTRNMPTPARSSGAAICSTAARCSVRCPTTGRTIPKSPSCAATSTIPPGSIPNVSRKAYLDCEYVPDGDAPDEKTYRWGDFLEIAGGDARYAAMLVDRTAAGESEEGLHPETLVDQDIRDGEAFMLAGRPIAPEDAYDLPGTVHGLYKELADNVDRSGMLFRDWRGFAAGTDADDVLRAIEAAFGETEYSRAGTVLGAYADDTFMSPLHVAQDAPRDVTPLTPWEDEDGVAFLSRTLDADAGAPVPCLWYCMRDGEQGFEVGGVKLDCSKIGFDEVSAAAASNGIDSVLAYLGESPRGLEPLCDIAVRRVDAGMPDTVRHFGSQDEAMAMLSAITGCRVQAYGIDTLTYRASLGNAAAAKLAAGALAMNDRLSGRGDAVEAGRRL